MNIFMISFKGKVHTGLGNPGKAWSSSSVPMKARSEMHKLYRNMFYLLAVTRSHDKMTLK
jgi:hypothetical protein